MRNQDDAVQADPESLYLPAGGRSGTTRPRVNFGPEPEPCRACGAPVLESADLCTNGHTAIGLLRFLEKNAACVHYEGAMGAGDIHPIMREIWEADAETQMQARSKDAA